MQRTALIEDTKSWDDYKLYPSAFIVLDSEGLMTKHYYNGSERVASRLTMAPDNMQKGTE